MVNRGFKKTKIFLLKIYKIHIYPAIKFWELTYKICYERDIFSLAQSLSYVTVVSLVPLFALFFFILSRLVADDSYIETIQGFVSEYLFPSYAQSIGNVLNDLYSQTLRLGLITFPSLIFAGLILYTKVDFSINRLWGSLERRGLFSSFKVFVNMLFIVPIVIALFFSSIFSGNTINKNGMIRLDIIDVLEQYIPSGILFAALPFIFSFLLFFSIYYFIPTEKVKIRSCLVGAFWASVSVKVINVLISFYLANIAKFGLIYGSLSLLPSMLLWLYMLWFGILFGSVLVYVNQTFANKKFVVENSVSPVNSNLDVVFKILIYLQEVFYERKPQVDLFDLCYILNLNKIQVERILKGLARMNIVSFTLGQKKFIRSSIGYQLACAPSKISISEIIKIYGLKRLEKNLSPRISNVFWQLDNMPYSKFLHFSLEDFVKAAFKKGKGLQYYTDSINQHCYNIEVENLKANITIGINKWEKTLVQPVVISLKIWVLKKQLISKDDIDKTVNYHSLVQDILTYLEGKKYNLLETLAEDIFDFLKKYKLLKKAWIKVSKPYAGEGEKISVQDERLY